MADQNWLSLICGAALASFLGHFYRKWVTPEMNFLVINIVFGGCFLFCLIALVYALATGRAHF